MATPGMSPLLMLLAFKFGSRDFIWLDQFCSKNVHRGYRTFPITWVLVVKLIEFIEINLMIEISFSTVLTGFFYFKNWSNRFLNDCGCGVVFFLAASFKVLPRHPLQI